MTLKTFKKQRASMKSSPSLLSQQLDLILYLDQEKLSISTLCKKEVRTILKYKYNL